MKKWVAMLLCVGLVFGSAGCGEKSEEPAKEIRQEETADDTALEEEKSQESGVDEELSKDAMEWFQAEYGTDGPDWAADVMDIKIVNLENGKRSLVIESANTDETVASSMAMIIWGYDDTIEFVTVYDQAGNTLYSNI